MKQCAPQSCSPRTITQNHVHASAAAQTALSRGKPGESQWLIRMESVPGSPSLCWKRYKAQSVILMVLTFFSWRKLRASPVLSGSSLHWDMRTLRVWKTFKWLSLAPQVLQPVTHKRRKGNVTILTWCNVAQEGLSLQLIISIKATFFPAEEACDSWGWNNTWPLWWGTLPHPQQHRHSQQDFPFRVSVLHGDTPATCAELPCREVLPATLTTWLQSTDTKHNSFLKLKMLSCLLMSSIQPTSAGQPNPKLAVVQQS